jgi:hypothetical protein
VFLEELLGWLDSLVELEVVIASFFLGRAGVLVLSRVGEVPRWSRLLLKVTVRGSSCLVRSENLS